jgi:hypothetical protein
MMHAIVFKIGIELKMQHYNQQSANSLPDMKNNMLKLSATEEY